MACVRSIKHWESNVMKTKRIFLAVSITALILAITLISLRAYYVTIALIAGTLIIGHRELWSLIRRRGYHQLMREYEKTSANQYETGSSSLS